MSEKLEVKNIKDIPKIIEVMVKMHGVGIVGDILDGLLSQYNHTLLIDTIKNKVHTENKERHEFFLIGLNVYMYKDDQECSMQKAIFFISDEVGIKKSTIQSHLDAFRKKIREDIEALGNMGGYSKDIKDVEKFIVDFIKILNDCYLSYNHESESMIYIAPKRKKSVYKKDYEDFLETIRGQHINRYGAEIPF